MRTGEWQQAHDRNVPKKNQDTISPKQSPTDFSKRMQVVFDMKAEMGCMGRAMTNAGISFEKSPSGPKLREQPANGKQKNKFAGAAKKNKANRIAQKSLVLADKTELSDSDDENQLEAGNVAIVVKPKKHVSPRLINAMMVGITRRNSESCRISECDAYEDQSWGNDEVEAQMMTDESMHQENLFGRLLS